MQTIWLIHVLTMIVYHHHTQAAICDAIEPTVAKYLSSLQAEQAALEIASLRQSAEALAATEEERKWIRQQLHSPTVALRRGESVDLEAFLDNLQRDLDRIIRV